MALYLSAFTLLNLREKELFQRFVGETERRRFFERLVRVPAVDHHALHEPHACGPSTARSMNERGLDAGRRDRLEERVDGRRIRRRCAERDVVVRNVGCLRCSDVPLDVGAPPRRGGGGGGGGEG